MALRLAAPGGVFVALVLMGLLLLKIPRLLTATLTAALIVVLFDVFVLPAL